MKKILSFLGVNKPEKLMGKSIKISFFHSGDNVFYNFFFTVVSFSLDKKELAFPPILFTQGLREIQVSIFSDNDFHITITKNNAQQSQEAYFYSGTKIKSDGISKGKVQLIK
jgi:hypothetical protein